VADAISRCKAARLAAGCTQALSTDDIARLTSADVIADAIAAQTAAIQANTQVLADFAQQVYEDGMYDDEEEVDEDWDVDDDRDTRLRNLGDA